MFLKVFHNDTEVNPDICYFWEGKFSNNLPKESGFFTFRWQNTEGETIVERIPGFFDKDLLYESSKGKLQDKFRKRYYFYKDILFNKLYVLYSSSRSSSSSHDAKNKRKSQCLSN